MANSRTKASRKNRQANPSPGTSSRLSRCWESVLDVALTAWVLRIPIAWGLFGFALLWLAPQAQDLLINVADDFDGNIWRVVGFLAVLTLVWAVPVHYVSRLLLDNDERFQARVKERGSAAIIHAQRSLPRFLGLIPFAAMLFACGRAEWNLPNLAPDPITPFTRLAIYQLAGAIAAAGALFFVYMRFRERLAQAPLTMRAERIAAPAMQLLRRFNPFSQSSSTFIGGESYLGPLLLFLMFFFFALLPLFLTAPFAEWMPLAFFVPFVVGGWLPLLAWLSALGRRFRAPLIFALIVVSFLIPRLFGDGYGVRPVTDESNAQAITIQEALRLWRLANCKDSIDTCPRPIIVAGAGGASRAGFFLSSVIGAFMDDTLRAPDQKRKLPPQGHGLQPQDIRKRIFAFSTVSGSSVGAVMTASAMAAAPRNEMPCRREKIKFWHWDRVVGNWRDCLEALMADDYLTPVFAGFMFRDTIRFPGRGDRAALLEQSWEHHFARTIVQNNLPKQLACEGSLQCPFRTLRPTEQRWLPLLVLNGTSVQTGQRIVTSILEWPAEIDAKRTPANACINQGRDYSCPIFLNTYLFHWLSGGRNTKNDVRLSTAAHNSARFPLVSPPGEIFSGGQFQDRIVDGGYYENYGVTSALELAAAIQAIEPALAPFVLVISNDPDIPEEFDPAMAPGARRQFVTDIAAPMGTIIQARSASGNLAVASLEQSLRPGVTPECETSSAHIRVWPFGPERQLTMSWWLSRPVQRYLNAQIGAGDACVNDACMANAAAIHALLAALNRAPGCRGNKGGQEALQKIRMEEIERGIAVKSLIMKMNTPEKR